VQFGEAALRALTDEKLFAKHFQPAATWSAWMTVLRVLFGMALSAADLALFEQCTGRAKPFAGPLTEAWLLCGRRSGKSRILALIAVMLACLKDYSRLVSAGERVIVMVLAVDRAQANVIFEYARAFILETPLLAPLLMNETAETLDLTNGVSIEIHTCSYKSVRGRTLAVALCDEIAFWRTDDCRNPGTAVIAARRPSLGSIPDALLLCASSTYDRTGVAYEAFEKYHGDDSSEVMVWRAPTRLMNPKFKQSYIDAAFAKDPLSAAAEYDSEFRTDVAAFFDEAVVSNAIIANRRMLGKMSGCRYFSFCDPSGGKHDAFTLAVAHEEKRPGKDGERIVRVVLDALRVVNPPFDPETTVRELAELLGGYGLHEVTGDRYGGEWPPTAFRRHGIVYKPSERTRSEIYLEVLAIFMQGKVELLDLPLLRKQLLSLERKTHAGGRDSVDHFKGSHDDAANSCCGALLLAATKRPLMKILGSVFDDEETAARYREPGDA
jgi:hypothetical protein